MEYMVIIEKSGKSYGAYVPDLPGCIAAADSEEEVKHLIKEAIEFHIEGLREVGDPIPAPSSESIYVKVDAAA